MTSTPEKPPYPARSDKPIGAYRRAVRIKAEPGLVAAEMEDDVHHFRVRLRHAGGRVTEIEGDAVRTPWVICPGALAPLRALAELSLAELQALDSEARSRQCMHIFDLALLAAAHARDIAFERLYRIEADHDQQPPQITLWSDGEKRLSWKVDGAVIRGSAYDGAPLNTLTSRLAGASADEREAAIVLRRASLISFVRRVDLDGDGKTSSSRSTVANCYARQPERRAQATRIFGNTRDFWGRRQWPLETPADAGAAGQNETQGGIDAGR